MVAPVKYCKYMVYVQNIPSKRVSPGICRGLLVFDLYIQYSGSEVCTLRNLSVLLLGLDLALFGVFG